MKVRSYVGNPEIADGKDEGGFFIWKDVSDISGELKNRMSRCAGCHDAFYNNRVNIGANHCWSLSNGKNFKTKGLPKCFH